MATLNWLGKAKDVANAWTITLADPHVGAVVTVTVNGNDFTHTITQAEMDSGAGDEAAAIAAIIANIVTEWNAQTTPPEFVEITASGTTTLILTMDTAGKPTTVAGSVASAGSAQNEVQTLSATVTPTSGTYTLTYDGQTTGNIAYGANAATIETALEALSNVSADGITVAGGPLGTDITFTFDGTGDTENTNVKTITIDTSALDSSAYTGTATVTNTTHGASAATTFGESETTAATGRAHWDNGDNWSGGSTPGNSDDVIVENTAAPIKYGFAQSAVTLTSLTIRNTLPGFFLGLPDQNTDAGQNVNPLLGTVTAYAEFRTKALAISATTVNIDCDASLIRLNTGTNATSVNAVRTGRGDIAPALRLSGAHNSNAYYVGASAQVGIAVDGGTTATIDVLSNSGECVCGTGVTFSTATISQQAGNLTLASNWQTLNQFGGNVYNTLAATGTTITQEEGTFFQESTGTLGTADVSGVFDASRNAKAKTTTNFTLREGGTLNDPNGSHTETNGIDVYGKLSDVKIIKPSPRTYTVSAV